MKCCNYRGLNGSLNYLANTSRPDITFVVRSLNRFVQNPGRQHWNQAKHVLRHLKATKIRKLIYEKTDEMSIGGYSDAYWAGKIDSRKSTSVYCFFLNETSSAISWNSKLQRTVATSIAEAEATALFAATQELIFLRELGAELGMTKSLPSSVFVDNQACTTMTNNAVNSEKVKHFAIKLHFLQEKIDEKVLEVKFCPTENMTADVLTKASGMVKFQGFSNENAGDKSTQKDS